MSFDNLLHHSQAASAMIEARENIPSPKGLPFVGNLLDVQNEVPIHGLEHMADIYGPIMKLNLMGKERIFVASAELVEEICDEKRFWKTPGDGLAALNKDGSGSRYGLFSAPSEDSMDWQLAHRTLISAFGPLNIQQMFDEMHDIASQLVLKWARKGPTYQIPVTLDFTRLTLDTIALCAMDYRFNSFYQDEMHPFVDAMNTTLTGASQRLNIGSMVRKLVPWDKSKENIQKSGEYMGQVASELVQFRRDNPTEKADLLNAMVNGKDPKTGQKMDDKLIASNMVTFLIAGHETTSGLLSFAMLYLLKNPEAYFKAQKEVDDVIGRGKMTVDHLKDLHYINAVLRETLRLTPTAPAFSRSIRGDNPNDVEPLGGEYGIRRDDKVLCLLAKAQRDPKVYGEDANEFKPERMLEENFQRLPKGAWKPFGTGVRACIGRAFAWQEAQMVLALLFQSFNFCLDDPRYELKVKQSLTIKPKGLNIRATLREGITATNLHDFLSSSSGEIHTAMNEGSRQKDTGSGEGKPMTIVYGSNTGTCQSLAQKLSIEARGRGFKAEVKEMNAAAGVLPKDQPVAIITASYEGQPTDNGDQFVAWLESSTARPDLQGVEYAVFGCGHSDWKNTFHRIPSLVDSTIENLGGKRIADRGLTDAAKNSIFSDFETWTDKSFWPAVAPDSSTNDRLPASLEIEMSTHNRRSYLRQDVQAGTVVESKSLTGPGEPEKRHLAVQLSPGQTYQTGDYLAILPLNPPENVSRVMRHFQIPQDATLSIKPGAATFLPTGVTLSVTDLLKGFVELAQPATKKDIQACIAATKDSSDEQALTEYLSDERFSQMAEHRVSVLDVLCKHTSVELSFNSFISMLPPLVPRHYSISSSPLQDPTKCTITYGVLDLPSLSGSGRFIGVTSTYLSTLVPGDEILVSVRATNKFFRLPADPESCPLIMFGAGTGLAPFRGFIQERAIQKAAGRKLAPAVLFMGCRSSTSDRLYAEEMDQWAQAGAVDIRYAYSKESENSSGCKYVQDRMLKDKDNVVQMMRDGAKAFVCGGPAVSHGIGDAARRILRESREEAGEHMTEEEAEEWFKARRNERYVVDVFA